MEKEERDNSFACKGFKYLINLINDSIYFNKGLKLKLMSDQNWYL